jgi:hypothetical protein
VASRAPRSRRPASDRIEIASRVEPQAPLPASTNQGTIRSPDDGRTILIVDFRTARSLKILPFAAGAARTGLSSPRASMLNQRLDLAHGEPHVVNFELATGSN